MKKTTFLLSILVFVFVVSGFKCGVKEFDTSHSEGSTDQTKFYEWLPLEVPDLKNVHTYKTPQMATVSSVDPIPEEAKASIFKAIDDGIARSIETTEGRGWTAYRKHSEVNIILIRPQYRSEVNDAGLLRLKPQYGDITFCGITIGTESNPFIASPFIIMAQNWEPKYLSLVRDCTRHEVEHLESINDVNEYNQFKSNDVHPRYILPDDGTWYTSTVQ